MSIKTLLIILASFFTSGPLSGQNRVTYAVDNVPIHETMDPTFSNYPNNAPITVNPNYVKVLKDRGDQGYELVAVSPYILHVQGSRYSIGITLFFKRLESESEERLNYLANKIDSIADNYVKREVANAQAEMITTLDINSERFLAKEFKQKVSEIVRQLMKENLEKMKEEIILAIKEKKQQP